MSEQDGYRPDAAPAPENIEGDAPQEDANPSAPGQNGQPPQGQPYGQVPSPQYGQPPQGQPYGQAPNPQYGQPPQGQPYGQAPGVPGQYRPQYGDGQPIYSGPELPKKKSKMPIAIGAIAVAIVGAISAFFMLGGDKPGDIGGVSREKEPEVYLQKALERTGQNAGTIDEQGQPVMTTPSIFDLERFSGKPTEYTLSLSIDELYDYYGASDVMGAEGTFSLLYDADAGNALLKMDVGFGGFSFKDNQVYISEDMVALSVPDLYTRSKYVSINPQTFVEQWNASEIGMYSPIDPDEFDMAKGIADSYVDMFNFSAMDALLDEYQQQITDMSNLLVEGSAFLDEGDMEITIDNVTYNVAKLGYSMPEEKIDGFIKDFMVIYKEMLKEYMGAFVEAMAQLDSYYTSDEIWDEMFTAMDMIKFPGGITCHYYIDLETGLVRRVDIPGMVMSVDTGYGAEEITMSIEMEYRGEERVSDSMFMRCDMTDDYGESITFDMTMNTPKDGPFGFSMNMDIEEGSLLMDMGYDPNGSGDNLWITFDLDDGYDAYAFDMRGSVTNNADGFSIDNGVMEFAENEEALARIGFGYGLRNVSPEDVAIDRSQAADFFDLDMNQLQQDIMAAVMRMSML